MDGCRPAVAQGIGVSLHAMSVHKDVIPLVLVYIGASAFAAAAAKVAAMAAAGAGSHFALPPLPRPASSDGQRDASRLLML